MINVDNVVKDLVIDYINGQLDPTDPAPIYDVFIVWKAKILQNYKYLVSTTLPDGMYYELTYNGDKGEWYLDAYKKFKNICIKEVLA